MLELIFVRHGETDSNVRRTYCGWTDVELNEEGIKQAYIAKQKLSGTKVDFIYSSPLKRTLKTAEIINESFGLGIKLSDRLKERNFGIWDDLKYEEIVGGHPEEYDLWVKDWVNYCIKDGESAMQQHTRVAGFLDSILESNHSGTFVIVTHHGCIRSAVAHLLGMRAEDAWHFKVGNCSITRVEIDNRYPVLTQLNG